MVSKNDFLEKLQGQARLQSKLSTSHILPTQLDFFTSLIGNYPWQFLLMTSFFSALAWMILGRIT